MRKLRNIGKMNFYNDSSRDLFESVVSSNVLSALKQLIKHNNLDDVVLIGSLAVSYHTRPYFTGDDDIDILMVNNDKRFKYFPVNRHKNGTRLHLHTPGSLGITTEEFEYTLKTSKNINGIKVASPSFIISLALKRFNIHDRCKVENVLHNCKIDMDVITIFNESDKILLFNDYIKKNDKDYVTKYSKINMQDYHTVKIFEGSSGYPEVDSAFRDWISNTIGCNQVLIGGLAVASYINGKFRSTTDADFIFLSEEDIPSSVNGFKRYRPGAFRHNKTHVDIEVITPPRINSNDGLFKLVFDTAFDKGNYKIASPSAIVAMKLGRFKESDIIDIKNLHDNFDIDVSVYLPYLDDAAINNYEKFTKMEF